MKKLLFVLLLMPVICYSQDSALTYSHILKFDSLSKDEIFDKALIWVAKAFENSNSAIKVNERQRGLIAGKAYYESQGKIPYRKDSIDMIEFNQYYFDWLIEIKDNKLRFTVDNVELEEYLSQLHIKHAVYTTPKPPYQFMFQSKVKTELYWYLSRIYFIYNLDNFMVSLNTALAENKTDW